LFDSATTYDKGGWVLHQLRHVVGDDTFYAILQAYRAQYQLSAASSADFAAVANTVSGQDLDYFFDEWVYGSGEPKYSYGWQTTNVAGQNYLQLVLSQTQLSSYGIFSMPLDVRIDTPDHNTYTVFDDAMTQWFLIPIPASATNAVLDENQWVLTSGKTVVGYVNGPAKLVATTPAPGSTVSAPVSQLSVQFSEGVNASAAGFSITGPSGDVPFAFSYSASAFKATLSFDSALPPGLYTVTADSGLLATLSLLALDGEIVNNTLPSGDGVPGGNAVFTFTVPVSCTADLNGDQVVDLTDLAILLAAFGQTGPNVADINQDGVVDLTDLAQLLIEYGNACL
jgi:methionine-rich copper-binding protein CopC